MNIFTSTPEREVIATVQYLPAVSIVIPFTPVITLKENLEYYLKNVMSKVEAMLVAHYTAEKAIPVIIKLKNLLSNLNYNTTQKSVAVFVSPVVEKVYYFEVEMDEKIVIDPSFKTSDLVYCKKEKKEYLILLLSDRFSTMYVSSNTQLKLIKSNTLINGDKNNAPSKTGLLSDLDNYEESVTNNFLLQMDNGLSMILRSYPLPVFVMGKKDLLADFKKITKNDQSIIQFITGNYDEFSGLELQCETETVVLCWEHLKQKHLLKQVEIAKTQNKLKAGVQQILEAPLYDKGKLLVVEKALTDHTGLLKPYQPVFKVDYINNEVFFIKDEVDDIIKRVFESGGDVEFVDNELLKNYGHIALIEN
jgi:hypothetical protein